MTLPDVDSDAAGWVHLPWDSDHFGIPIGRLQTPVSELALTRTLQNADGAGIQCLYWLSDPDQRQLEIAQRARFKKVDVRTELELDLALHPLPVQTVAEIRVAGESDLGPLKALASQSHRNTRFYTDGSFPTDRADALYAKWIERSFNDPTETVFVSGPPGEPVGYIAFGVTNEGPGSIGLVGVAESRRGEGIGSALVSAAIGRLADRGVERIEVVTQGDNMAAHGMYNGLGFTERTRSVWLHRWIKA